LALIYLLGYYFELKKDKSTTLLDPNDPVNAFNAEEGQEWMTFFIKHLFHEWKDSDRLYNVLRSKIETEIKELLEKSGKFLNREWNVSDHVRSIDIHHLEIGNVAPILADFKQFYHDENRNVFGFHINYGGQPDEVTAYAEISVDFERFKNPLNFKITLTKAVGYMKLALEKDPYSFWWCSFRDEPDIDFSISQIPTNSNNTFVKWFRDEFLRQKIKAIIKKHHKMPNYKIRHRPLLPNIDTNSIALPRNQEKLLHLNLLEITISEYSRFPIQFDLERPEAECFVKAELSLKDMKGDVISLNSIDLTVPEIAENLTASENVSLNNVEHSEDPDFESAEETEAEKTEIPGSRIVSSETTSLNTVDGGIMDQKERTSLLMKRKHFSLQPVNQVSKFKRNFKTLSFRNRKNNQDAETPVYDSVDEALTQLVDNLNPDQQLTMNKFGHPVAIVREPPSSSPIWSRSKTSCRFRSTFSTDPAVPIIKSNLPYVHSWKSQTFPFQFDPSSENQFIDFKFSSTSHSSKITTEIGSMRLNLQDIVAMTSLVNSRTIKRRFRVSKPEKELDKKLQSWRKKQVSKQRRFNDQYCHGDCVIQFKVSSTNVESDKSNQEALVEEELASPVTETFETSPHEFVPFNMTLREVGRISCAACGSRLFNIKKSHHRKCKFCDIYAHERCLESLKLQKCQKRFIEMQRKKINNTTRTETPLQDVPAFACLPVEKQPITYDLSEDTDFDNRLAYISKWLSNKFVEKKLDTNIEKLAMISYEQDKFLEYGKLLFAENTIEKENLSSDLKILSIFRMHYSIEG